MSPIGPGTGERSTAREEVGVAARTGRSEVDAALSGLDRLGGMDVGGHAEIYEDVHQRLARVLADATEPAPGA